MVWVATCGVQKFQWRKSCRFLHTGGMKARSGCRHKSSLGGSKRCLVTLKQIQQYQHGMNKDKVDQLRGAHRKMWFRNRFYMVMSDKMTRKKAVREWNEQDWEMLLRASDQTANITHRCSLSRPVQTSLGHTFPFQHPISIYQTYIEKYTTAVLCLPSNQDTFTSHFSDWEDWRTTQQP